MYDAIIVGGSYAGLSAALQLARARRRLLVVDAGKRRNRFAPTSHGFLTQDGRAPGDIAADARAQLMAYPTVAWADGEATSAEQGNTGFAIAVGASRHEAKRLVLATGVSDTLPAIPGLAERWGKSVFHCPYCHGYELDQGDIGVLGVSALSMHHALMLPDWGRTTFFLNGAFEPDAEQMAQLQARGVSVERQPIREMAGERADIDRRPRRAARRTFHDDPDKPQQSARGRTRLRLRGQPDRALRENRRHQGDQRSRCFCVRRPGAGRRFGRPVCRRRRHGRAGDASVADVRDLSFPATRRRPTKPKPSG